MTYKEIEKCRIDNGLNDVENYRNWSKEQRQLDNELMCRDTINHIMLYHGIYAPYKDDEFDYCIKGYIDKHEEGWYLGEDRVLELIKEQQEDFRKAIFGVSLDTQGVSR